VPDSESRLQHALTDTSADAARTVRALRDEGARFNVGGVYRNFNDPTFALNFLDATLQPRFKFNIDGHGKVGAREAVKISFQELQTPTLVRNGNEDARSSGALWISPVDGTVLRTRLTFSIREPVPASKGPVNVDDPDPLSTINTHAQIDVDYELVGPIDGWAPVRMHEIYEQTISTPKQRGSFVERITCTATYSQFQVYLTAGRILPSS